MNKKIAKLLVISTMITGCYMQQAFAYDYHNNEDQAYTSQADAYYEKGKAFLQANQYSNAIIELEKALKLKPSNQAIRNNLSVAYNSRATYYYNKKYDLDKAANDYRAALYYLKYYDSSVPGKTIKNNIEIIEKNLNSVLKASEQSIEADNRFKIARQLRGQGYFIQAVPEFQATLSSKEHRLESYEALGDIMRVLQKNYQAAKYYDKALALDSSKSVLHLKFARVLNKLDNVDAAVTEYNIALNNVDNESEILPALEEIWQARTTKEPNNPTAHMNLGAVYQKMKQLDKAMKEYKIAESLNPSDPAVRLNIATLHQERGDLQMALSAYDSILQVYPTDKVAHFYKAIALQKMGNIDMAILELDTVLSIDPKDENTKSELYKIISTSLPANVALDKMYHIAQKYPNDAKIQYYFAYMLHKNKRETDALAYYQRSIQLNANNTDAYINIATILKDKGEYQKASNYVETALKFEPENKKAQMVLENINNTSTMRVYEEATRKYNAKDYQGALTLYKSMKDPNSDTYVGIGACLQAQDQKDEAMTAYKKAIELNSKNATAYYYLGTLYASIKDYNLAEKNYKQAKIFDPKNPDIDTAIKNLGALKNEVLLDKALNHYNVGNYYKAIKTLDTAKVNDPSNAYVWYYRGMAYDAIKKYSIAAKNYQIAIQNDPKLDVAYYGIAIDYDTLGNKVEAKTNYQKFIELTSDQTSEYAKYAKERIRLL